VHVSAAKLIIIIIIIITRFSSKLPSTNSDKSAQVPKTPPSRHNNRN